MKLRIAILVFRLIIISIGDVYGADWKFYGSSENFLGYYDAQSITRLSKNIVRVWEKRNYTEKGIIDMVGELGKKYKDLSYSKALIEINCLEKMNCLLSGASYDNEGGVIYFFSFPSKWEFIFPESMAEILYKEICK